MMTEEQAGAVVRVLASHQCGPGSIPARYDMWVEFVVGSCPCSEGFFTFTFFFYFEFYIGKMRCINAVPLHT